MKHFLARFKNIFFLDKTAMGYKIGLVATA
jgi:hypothetical protein